MDEQTHSAESISSLEKALKTQEKEHEVNIKQKIEAFTKVQDQLQRLLDEAVASHQEKLAALQDAMKTQKNEYEESMQSKTDEFAKAQSKLQSTLSDTQRKLELVCNAFPRFFSIL